jgi:opacity protein-like surface antigen
MKKVFLLLIIAVFAIGSMSAQNFGVKAGVDIASVKAKFEGVSVSSSETGFYIGAFTEIEVSESFSFQPEALFVSISDLNQIHIPLMAKFPVSEEFNILAGPTLGLLLDAGEGTKSLNYGIEAGAAYDISEEFFVEARYNLGLADLSEGGDDFGDASLKLSGFFIGAGYRF